MKIAVIANPISGRGRAPRQVERFVDAASLRGHDVSLLLSRRAGEPRELAASLDGSSCETLVIAGGDGTLNESINGLIAPERIPIALIPSGTANLLARELQLPRNSAQLLDAIERGAVRRLDMGIVNGRRFLLVLSAGFDAMVIEEIHRVRNGRLGFRGYIGPILRATTRYRPPRMKITIDGNEGAPIEAGWIVVSNVRKYAGLFCITDRAECDSGCLDVCLFPRATRFDLVRYALAAKFGRASKLPGVCYHNATRLRVDSDEPTLVEIDGEFFGQTPLEITMSARCVPIVAPAANSKRGAPPLP